jgi:hypothetical protein
VVNVGRGPAHENQFIMGNVYVQSIGRIHVGFEVTDGDSSGGGEEERRRASGRRGGGLES